MSFGAPEWLFLAPALAVLGWRVPALRLHDPLRGSCLLVLMLALADPRWRFGEDGLDVWLLVDRSDSASSATVAQSSEVISILERTRKTGDRVIVVDYAAEAVRRDRGDAVLRGSTKQTRTGNALEFALAQRADDRTTRMLLLSDGFATEPLGPVAEQLLRSGVALDYRLVGREGGADFRVTGVETPVRVLPGEAFLVQFAVAGTKDGDVPWEVSRDGRAATSGTVSIRKGIGRVRLTDRLAAGGAVSYQVRLRPLEDSHSENNVASSWVEVAAGPRTLLVTAYADDPLAGMLRSQGQTVQVVTDAQTLTAASLTGARSVIVNNVPAHRVSPEFLMALDFFVREQGGGLLMTGGEHSFGAGGYFSSAIDPLLPVSMELRKEHRKLATAMAIILDRSGSMAQSVGGGRTKMDLANAGSARAIELLGDMDAVSVHAVDTVPHQIVELAQVGPNREAMIESVRRIASTGGGIYVYEGLLAGWAELQKAESGQRHLILFADAADAEQPGRYEELLAEMRKAGATVSVIGLGSEHDSDANFLKDVADRGGGRIFFNSDPEQLPAVFAQETVSIARSAFIKEVTPILPTPGWSEIGARAPNWLTAVNGYNLSYLRPGATASLITTDEYQAPLVATWMRGAGRVAAVSFAVGGDHSELVRGWSDYGTFVQTLSRWLSGEDVPAGLASRTTLEGERLTMDLLYDETWADRIAQAGPTATVAIGEGGRSADKTQTLIWEKIEPGHFRTTMNLPPGRAARGAIRAGGITLPFGPVATPTSAEWSFDRDRLQELRAVAERTGGKEVLDLASIWNSPRESHVKSFRAWLLAILLGLIVVEALMTRLGVNRAWPLARIGKLKVQKSEVRG